MASTYSSRLNLELQTTGENSGTWGTITNNNLQKLEAAIKGYVAVAIASTSDALTYEDGSTGLEQDNAIVSLLEHSLATRPCSVKHRRTGSLLTMRRPWVPIRWDSNQQVEQRHV